MIELFTIGFTGKTAKKFFDLLETNKVNKIVDTRVNNASQLSGFAKGNDLNFFAHRIANINYEHAVDFAPTKELLKRYRGKEMTWEEYEIEYLNLIDMRHLSKKVNVEELHQNCLLCSEHSPIKCHRRLLAEYFQKIRSDIIINHLK